jgi:PAS domain S-box-containing protein
MAIVLVVDDHPVNRNLVVTLLGYHGHTVLEAGDGAEALRIARAQPPDLIVTDLVMPVMDGYELVRELRADPRLAATRVIFYTANYLRDEVEPVAKALGVRHVVAKPAEPESLLAAADDALAEPPEPAPGPSEDAYRQYARMMSTKLADKVIELQAAETSLKESEARYRCLAESAPVGIFSRDPGGRVSYLNPRLQEICGLPPGAAERLWTDRLHTGDKERVLAGLAAAAAAGARYRGQARIMPLTGGLRWVQIQAVPLDNDGRQVAYVGTVEDVTEALEAQEQREELLRAQRAEAQLLGLLEAVPDAVVCVDADGRIVLVNAQTERLFGYRREELSGQPVEVLIPDAIKAPHLARRAEYVAHPRPRPMGIGMELTAQRRDGSTFPAEISLSAIDAGDGLLVMAVVRNITERPKLLAERERLRTQAAGPAPADPART